MTAGIALYFSFFLFTLAVIGLFFWLAKRSFGKNSDHATAMWNATRNSLRILSFFGIPSILLFNFNLVPASSIPFFCVPFFMVLTYDTSNFFRIRNHYNMVTGKKQAGAI